MANYAQPGYSHGRYQIGIVNRKCLLCSSNARSVVPGARQFQCDSGHQFIDANWPWPLPFAPVATVFGAEQRLDLVEWQEIKG